jgi:hypothetical protein
VDQTVIAPSAMPLGPSEVRNRAHDLARRLTAAIRVVAYDTVRPIQLVRLGATGIDLASIQAGIRRTARSVFRPLWRCRLSDDPARQSGDGNQRREQAQSPRHNAQRGASPGSECAHGKLLLDFPVAQVRDGRWPRPPIAARAQPPSHKDWAAVRRPVTVKCRKRAGRLRSFPNFRIPLHRNFVASMQLMESHSRPRSVRIRL